jgi:ankyrin repeat protein
MYRLVALTFSLLICFTSVSAQRSIDEDFLDAVEQKDIPRMNRLLSLGANINARSEINGYYALMYAINWPDINLVKLLLDKGARLNTADDSGDTALIEAADSGGPEYTAIVKLLLARGADVHANGDRAILSAARNAEPEVVKLLLAKGAPVNARSRNYDNNTVLMEAASGASPQTVDMLLAAGAEVNATNDKGETALMKAVTLDHRYEPRQRLPMIDALLKKGADINGADKSGRTPLLHALVQYMSEAGGVISHSEIVKLLLERGANVDVVDQNGDNALMITTSVYQGSPEIVQLLVAKGINLDTQNKKGTTGLMIAASSGKTDIVNLLLDKGANLNLVDLNGETALDHAIADGQIELAKSLFARAAISKNNYKTEAEMLRAVTNAALLEAASRGNLNDIKKQLAAGADINTRSRAGLTPLMLALFYGSVRLEVMNLLIDSGADLNAVDASGETALMIAIQRNSNEAVTGLISRKAAVYLKNNEGRTALHIAAKNLYRKSVLALLDAKPEVTASSAGVDVRGVEVNGKDGSGRTPLMLAADNEGFVPDEVMGMLLDHGAQIDEQDPQGNTALMFAAKAGSFSGVEYLVSRKANVNLKNNSGDTALKFARKIHETGRAPNIKLVENRVVQKLLRAGAKE